MSKQEKEKLVAELKRIRKEETEKLLLSLRLMNTDLKTALQSEK